MLKLNRFFFDQAISIDNALTTNQIIHQIIKQVKEVVDYVNSLETDAHEYTDAKVLELKNQLEQQISELETHLKGYADTKLAEGKAYTDSEIANLRLNYIDVKVREIYETITALDDRLNAKINLVDAILTNLIGDVRAELIELIKKGNAIIYSGYSGELIPLQDEITNIYNILSKLNGLTWDVFDVWIKNYNIAYAKAYPTDSTNRLFIFDKCIIESVTSSTINIITIIEGEDTITLSMVLPLEYSNIDKLVFFNSNGSRTDATHYGLNVNTDDQYTYLSVAIPTNIFLKNNYSYFFLREGETARLKFLVYTSPTVNTIDKQEITWSTIEAINDLTSNRLTYNLITYSFWSNLNNALSASILNDRQRIMQTMTNYGIFNDNYNTSFAGINMLNINVPCETIANGIKYDYSAFMKGE